MKSPHSSSLPASPSLPSFSLLGPAAVSHTSIQSRSANIEQPQTILYTIQTTSTPPNERHNEKDKETEELDGTASPAMTGNSKKAKKARAQALAQAQAQAEAQAQAQAQAEAQAQAQPQTESAVDRKTAADVDSDSGVISPSRANKLAKKQLLRDLSTKKVCADVQCDVVIL